MDALWKGSLYVSNQCGIMCVGIMYRNSYVNIIYVHFPLTYIHIYFMQGHIVRECTRYAEEWPWQGLFEVSQGVI